MNLLFVSVSVMLMRTIQLMKFGTEWCCIFQYSVGFQLAGEVAVWYPAVCMFILSSFFPSVCTWDPEQIVGHTASMAGQRAVKGLDKHPFVPLGAVALHRRQNLPQLIPAPHGVQVLAQGTEDKVFSAGLHGSNLSPSVAPGVIPTGSPYSACPPSGMFHLTTHHKQEVPHDGHTVMATPCGHGRQLTPVWPACHTHVILGGGVEVP